MSLISERRLYRARRGPYTDIPDPGGLLAERVDAIISSEYTKFKTIQEQAAAEKKEAASKPR
jgi:hypothetical protein